MREFLKSPRRMAGCVLLAVALVLTSTWARSLNHRDGIYIPNKTSVVAVESVAGTVRWKRIAPRSRRIVAATMRSTGIGDESNPWNGMAIQWRWSFAGFSFGTGNGGSPIAQIDQWVVPYSSFTVPMVLLASYLLIRNPRRDSEDESETI